MSNLDDIMDALGECLDGATDKQLEALNRRIEEHRAKISQRGRFQSVVVNKMYEVVQDELGYRNQMEHSHGGHNGENET